MEAIAGHFGGIDPMKFDNEELYADALASYIAGRFSYRWGLQVYSKEDILSEGAMANVFDAMHERSMDGRYTAQGSSLRFLPFHFGDDCVDLGGEAFYRKVIGKLAEFLRNVPEYARNENIARFLEHATIRDFSWIYGQIGHKSKPMDEKGQNFEWIKPPFDDSHNLAANMIAFCSEYVTPAENEGAPHLIPLFNFGFPEVPKGEEERKRAIETLKSYATKISCLPRTNELALKEQQLLTSEEKLLADQNGTVVSFAYAYIALGAGNDAIIAAPLYGVQAIPYNESGTSWMKTILSNETILDEFRGFGRLPPI